MTKNNSSSIQDLLELFEDTLSTSDILASKLVAQITTAIVKERLKLHMNQTEFAKRIGVSQAQVSQWEKGDYNFSLRKIAEILSALDLDVNIMVSDPRTHRPDYTITHNSNSSFTKTIVYSADEKSFVTARSPHGKQMTFSTRDFIKEDKKHVAVC